ncbi:MAG: putative membrane protein insertion efficiency factor [Candidatus Anoxychlamydiales bacterium]|nr:putative membrane protein insertion efficiency factor [Candidatus Anoxychlamydiales bacterium]
MKRLAFLLILTPLFVFSQAGYFEPWGKDSDLKHQSLKIENNKKNQKKTIFSKAANKVIVFHQKVISPVCGSRSNFRPTSSRYMQLAIERYGFLKGFAMGCDRLIRENSDPWVYRKILIDNTEYKFDPAFNKKYITLK